MNQGKLMKNWSKHPLRVMKFGGTSVGDAERIERVTRTIAEHARQAAVVVVVSAMEGVTEMLIADAAARGNEGQWQGIGMEFSQRHREVAERLLPEKDRATLLRWLSGP